MLKLEKLAKSKGKRLIEEPISDIDEDKDDILPSCKKSKPSLKSIMDDSDDSTDIDENVICLSPKKAKSSSLKTYDGPIENQENLIDVDLENIFCSFEEDANNVPSSSSSPDSKKETVSATNLSFNNLIIYPCVGHSRKPEIFDNYVNIYSPNIITIKPFTSCNFDTFCKIYITKKYILHFIDIPYLCQKGLKIMQQDIIGESSLQNLNILFYNMSNNPIVICKGQCISKIVMLKSDNRINIF